MGIDYAPVLSRAAEGAGMDVKAAKHQMRVHATRQRATIFKQYVVPEQAGFMLRDSFLTRCPLPRGAVVAGYWPIDDEIDIRPLLNSLADHGHPVAMPVVLNRQQPMRFRRWNPGMVMQPGRFGIPTPPDTFPEVRPDVVLVPLLAFDRQGYRLGRGSGFYDHTLELLRATGKIVAMGIAFSGQEVPVVPHDAYDQRLDWIVTEHYALACSPGGTPQGVFGSLR
jgi:5-formyltetrahydrofolate cyclo-ligase